jgi:SAC3 family protein LENG8/THP3
MAAIEVVRDFFSCISHSLWDHLPAVVLVELNLYVSQLTSKQKASLAVKHALAVQRALALGNYHAFFEQYLSAPNMGAYIMDHFVDRERLRALLIMTKACV